MEVVGAYRIFERSNVRDVQYNEYYGDGDSKGYESVKNFYGINTVTKRECIGQETCRGAVASIKKNDERSSHFAAFQKKNVSKGVKHARHVTVIYHLQHIEDPEKHDRRCIKQ
ncbi:uncharacterized protein LOC101238613 [Trichonephila clavipes]|nr:uncharacterized protein LOC101238613 [Trichonephila clavipes]